MSQKILIVEDEPLLLEMLLEIFEEENLICEKAKDGKDAYDKLINNEYAVVLTDINMPKMNGVDLIKMAKMDPEVKQPRKWFAFTAHMDNSKKDSGLELFDESFFKPFNPELIAKIIKKELG